MFMFGRGAIWVMILWVGLDNNKFFKLGNQAGCGGRSDGPGV